MPPTVTCGLWCYYMVLQVPSSSFLCCALCTVTVAWTGFGMSQSEGFSVPATAGFGTLHYTPGSLGWAWLLVCWIWSSPKARVLPGFSSALLSSADLTDQEMGGIGSKMEKNWQLVGACPFNPFCLELKAFFFSLWKKSQWSFMVLREK